MESERLRESLEELRAEINASALGESPARDRLNDLITAIERKLDAPEDEEHHASLVASVKDSIHQLETQHPRATSILNQIMAALGGVGI